MLRDLRVAERALLSTAAALNLPLDPKSLRLRSGTLKTHREWRDAALFSYGMGIAKGIKLLFAQYEGADYDFVTRWAIAGQDYFCAVQLKELPPDDLAPRATMGQLVHSLEKYSGGSDTVLAIKLSKRPDVNLQMFRLPEIPFAEAYLFWGTAPGSASFLLYGDVKGTAPNAVRFDYPGSR